jgi:SAM-dependent methyltransferase
MKSRDIRTVVRKGYAKVAKGEGSSPSRSKSCCCGPDLADTISKTIGYSDKELKSVPEGANLGLGCGNPLALASIKKGDTVLDLGSGAGFDCFLAANNVGKEGKVIGVDMTPEMLEKARENARKGSYKNVEFRLGEIENLPVADNSVDLVISNCVINLSPDKKRVFKEAFRVLKPGGKLMVSDIVLLKPLPDFLKKSEKAYVACLSGAIMKDKYMAAIEEAGFQKPRIVEESLFPMECIAEDPTAGAVVETLKITKEQLKEFEKAIASIKVGAMKPGPKT